MTNPLSIIRPLTADDAAALDASALRFAARHCLSIDTSYSNSPAEALDAHLWAHDCSGWTRLPELRRLWQACRCRALGVPVSATIAVSYGYIGHKLD